MARKPQVFLHRLAFDDFARAVMFECEGIFALRAFVTNDGDFRKEVGHVWGA